MTTAAFRTNAGATGPLGRRAIPCLFALAATAALSAGPAANAAGASAEEVARAARGDLKCPPAVKTPPRAAGAPAVDVVGVQPGMSWDEAAATVMCSHPLLVVREEAGRGFTIDSQGQKIRQGFNATIAKPQVERSGRQIMAEMQRDAMARGMNARREDLQPGEVKWFVGTMGVPGDERVLSAARKERPADGQDMTVQAVEKALVAKYGEPTRRLDPGDGRAIITWAYDPLGRRIGEASPLFGKCMGAADPDAGVNLTPDCGVVVSADLRPKRDNKALVETMMVGVVDIGGGYKRIAATEQALRQADQQRRAGEVERASKNAKGPTL